MCQVNEADGDGSLSSLLVCDRCEKVRSVKGDVPDGRWTCCHQPEEVSANNGAAGFYSSSSTTTTTTQTQSKGKEVAVEEQSVLDKKGKGVVEDVEDGGGEGGRASARAALTFSCVSCRRSRSLLDGMSEASVSRCCDVPDAQVVSVCGGARIASQLLQAGVATQEVLAALDVNSEEDGSGELSRVASAARVNHDALLDWVTQARGRELDEVMHDLLAPPHPEVKSWDVKLLFARLEERAGVSTPADLAAAPIDTTLLPALHGLNVTARDLVLMRAKAEARLVEAPPWMAQAKLTFPTYYGDSGDKGEGVGDDEDEDTVDLELLRVALQTMREHPDIAQAGESVRYLYRISCNIVDNPEEARYRRLRLDNRAYVARVCGVKGAALAMEALGWRESPDGSTCVLPQEGVRISSVTTDVILDCMKGLITRAALNSVAASGADASRPPAEEGGDAS